MSVHVFGIRHHGPGCARALLKALGELAPDVVVMEGPADAQEIVGFANHEEMKPPVAMLVYPVDEPQRGVYYPMTVFSPEWQAMRWAIQHQVPVRLMDLPQSHQIAIEKEQEAKQKAAEEAKADETSVESEVKDEPPTWRTDPLTILAEAGGYKDHELWWEEQVERRVEASELFTAIPTAMMAVREEVGEQRPRDLLRESFMRKTIRAVHKEGFTKVAVICGAWHAPVLTEEAVAGKIAGTKIKEDNERLTGLPKIKTTATWVPWTNLRLTYRSGYGAGIHSPGWYQLVWEATEDAPTRWIATAARLLREKDLAASSASIIEAKRLSDALAAMRHLRSPGLAELNESILSVFCQGDVSPMRLIHRRLEIGDELGQVPAETPTVPLAQDLAALQKSLRFKPSTESKLLDLDLRKENDLAKSHLLHRLAVLDVPWGDFKSTGGKSSTFHEVWQTEWKAEFAVKIIEASVWGNTVLDAATKKVLSDISQSQDLTVLTGQLKFAMLAELSSAMEPLLERVQSVAAVSADVRHLMESLLPMAQVARYGDVRGGRASQVEPILIGMFERVLVGLVPACGSLDDDAADRMKASIASVGSALGIINRDDLLDSWTECIRRLMDSKSHALLTGWCCRYLLEQHAIDDEELYRRARLALSTANPPLECGHWAMGFLHGSGLLVLQHDAIWNVFDRWLASLSPEAFVEMLPLLRRAFSSFTGPERRQMGEKVRDHGRATTPRKELTQDKTINSQRAARVLPILTQLLGTPSQGVES